MSTVLKTENNQINTSYADSNQLELYTKFPSTHYLANPNNCHNVLLWNTFFRRNLHRLAIDYLGIKLHLYQVVILYFMGICHFIAIIASRAAAKSFIIALYSCCRCITRPNSLVVLTSATKGQAKLIVEKKIKQELMSMSPTLKDEIARFKDNQNDIVVYFKNGSTITVIPALESGRGNRSTVALREEFRQIDKKIDDSVISPFQVVRQSGFMMLSPYTEMDELKEEPIDIYISSSWYDDGHWMWDIVSQANKEMLDENPSCLLAFDESVVLKHGIKTKKQLLREKKKQDPLTWRIEFLNERVKQNSAAFFTYNMLTQNQILRQPFYPRTLEDFKSNKKNPYAIPKQQGEIRIVACDFAFMEGANNDNSVFSCIRALPEMVTHYDEEDNSRAITSQGYRRVVPYIESQPGGDTTRQAIRIRQLYADFDADYLVIDTRNAGVSIFFQLAKTLYDEQRNIEYDPLTCMNNDDLANSIKIPGAKPVIYAINATQKLNSDIAFDFKNTLIDKNINLLIGVTEAVEEILMGIDQYCKGDETGEARVFFEMPFIETQLFIHEASNLLYEKSKKTGVISVYEQGNSMKDRYTSVSYGSYFISQLEKDLISNAANNINSDISYLSQYITAPKIRGLTRKG